MGVLIYSQRWTTPDIEFGGNNMYKQIRRMTKGKHLPMVAKSADNENVIIE